MSEKDRLKSRADFNFNYITDFNIDLLKQKVTSFSPLDWEGKSASERKSLYRDGRYPLKETGTYVINETGFANLFLIFQYHYLANKLPESVVVSPDKEIPDIIEPVVKYLEELSGGVRGNIILAILPAGKEIAPHADYNPGESGFERFLDKMRRYHIPIITNSKCTFSIGEDTMSMLEGQCWEINNSRYHSVSNLGDTDRVHLIIDIMPDSVRD